jgi:hypothetical protein
MTYAKQAISDIDLKQIYLKAEAFLRPHTVNKLVIPFQVRTLSVYIPKRYREHAKQGNNYRDLCATVCLLRMKDCREFNHEIQAFWSVVLNNHLATHFDESWTICAVPSAIANRQTPLYALATEVSEEIGMGDGSDLVTRQIDIPRSNERQRHDKRWHFNSIQVDPEVAGRKILLLDDVVTTGTTLSAIGQMLMEEGAATVSAITLAETCYSGG